MVHEKIIQIIPAPDNLYALNKDEGGKFTTRIVCLALTNNGDVFMMDTDSLGDIGEIADGADVVNYEVDSWNKSKN